MELNENQRRTITEQLKRGPLLAADALENHDVAKWQSSGQAAVKEYLEALRRQGKVIAKGSVYSLKR